MNGRGRMVTAVYEGEELTKNLQQWSNHTGIAAGTIHHRIFGAGWDPTRAVNTPPKESHRTNKAKTIRPKRRQSDAMHQFLYPVAKEGLTPDSECGIMGVRTSEVQLI